MGAGVLKRAAAVVAAALLAPSAAAAAVKIVDTGTPESGAWVTSISDIFASQFSVAEAFTIETVEAHLGADGGPAAFKLMLFANGPGMPGGRLFESKTFTLEAGEARWVGSAVNWNIDPGVYWIGLQQLEGPIRQSTWAPQPLGNEARIVGGRVVFDYDGLDLGWRISGEPQPVPEPAAWALMILGFGGAGGALRRRRRAGRLRATGPALA